MQEKHPSVFKLVESLRLRFEHFERYFCTNSLSLFFFTNSLFFNDEEPQRTVCVDDYIANALTKHATYLDNFAAEQAAKSQQSPSTRSATTMRAASRKNDDE